MKDVLTKLKTRIFSMNNPNCKIHSKPNIQLFLGIPITYNGEKVIGVTPFSESDYEWVDGDLFADVTLFTKYLPQDISVDSLTMINYFMSGKTCNGLFFIEAVNGIEFGLIHKTEIKAMRIGVVAATVSQAREKLNEIESLIKLEMGDDYIVKSKRSSVESIFITKNGNVYQTLPYSDYSRGYRLDKVYVQKYLSQDFIDMVLLPIVRMSKLENPIIYF